MDNIQGPKEKQPHIIEAAARLFARRGYAGANISQIAAEAGIGKGTIYEYFASKEDLFFAVFEWYLQNSGKQARVKVSALGGSASDRLLALSDSILDMWDDIEDVFTLTMEFWAASASSQIRDRFKAAFRELYAEFRHLVVSLLRDGIERGEFRENIRPDSIAAALVGTWDALFLQAWFDDNFNPVTTGRDFIEVIIAGISK